MKMNKLHREIYLQMQLLLVARFWSEIEIVSSGERMVTQRQCAH